MKIRNLNISLSFALLVVLIMGSASPALASASSIRAPGVPPYSGTIFIDPDIVTSADPTTFISASYTGRGLRTVFDRRVNDWVTINAYLFNAKFSDGLKAEVQVNPEFGSSNAAKTQADKYAWYIGQLPTALRQSVKSIWIHKGTQPFGGGNNSILIHVGQSAVYEADGILEETLIHEASHTSLDAKHAASSGWLTAQSADGEFISTYAQDNPTREDVAESFLIYYAIRYRADRVDANYINTATTTMPNRIAYFDAQGLDMFPVSPSVTVKSQGANDGWILESKASSNKGGTLNGGGATLNLGDNAANKQYRSILSFDTTLPVGAVITNVKLKVKRHSVTGGGNPITAFGGIIADVKNGSFDTVNLALGDFNLAANKSLGAAKPTAVSGWYTLNLSGAKNLINSTGTTQIRLRFKVQDNKNALANILSLYSGNAAASNQPKLIIQYYIP